MYFLMSFSSTSMYYIVLLILNKSSLKKVPYFWPMGVNNPTKPLVNESMFPFFVVFGVVLHATIHFTNMLLFCRQDYQDT